MLRDILPLLSVLFSLHSALKGNFLIFLDFLNFSCYDENDDRKGEDRVKGLNLIITPFPEAMKAKGLYVSCSATIRTCPPCFRNFDEILTHLIFFVLGGLQW